MQPRARCGPVQCSNVQCSPVQCSPVQCSLAARAMQPRAMQPHIVLSVELGSQQKADVVKTDYSDSLLMITRLKTRMIITIDAVHITLN